MLQNTCNIAVTLTLGPGCHRRAGRRPPTGAGQRGPAMRYRFADCVLDTQLYTLHRAGTARPLRPKVFQVLCYLLEHRDHVVSKDALCTQVWPDQFISDAALESTL